MQRRTVYHGRVPGLAIAGDAILGHPSRRFHLVPCRIPPKIPAPLLPGFGWPIHASTTFWYTVLSWVGCTSCTSRPGSTPQRPFGPAAREDFATTHTAGPYFCCPEVQ